jgi:hypothetical protein
MKKLKLISIFIFIATANIVAQENDSLKTSKVQVTFAYPLGNKGTNSMKYSNNFSFNVLYGLNGGVNGAEIGSIFNFNKGIVRGFQLSGISNICLKSTNGLVISGVLNYSKQNSKGFQLSTVNVCDNEFRGLQLGVVNYSKKLKGIQVGLFNLIDSGDKSLPIGLFSIVKNGYYELELTGGDAINYNLNFKMGVEKFYTIFKTGYSLFKNNSIYSVGLGFGSNVPISEKQKISIDLSYNQIVYNNYWDNGKINILNKADFNYKYSFSNKFSVLIGPSFNIYITEEKVEGKYGTLNIPNTIYSNERMNSKLFMWFGINAGLSLKL